MQNTLYADVTKMSRRDLSQGVALGWTNLFALTPYRRAEVLPRLICFEATLARRANVGVSFPEVNGLTLDQCRDILRDARIVWDNAHNLDVIAPHDALALITELEDRIIRLTRTQATRDRITLILQTAEARNSRHCVYPIPGRGKCLSVLGVVNGLCERHTKQIAEAR